MNTKTVRMVFVGFLSAIILVAQVGALHAQTIFSDSFRNRSLDSAKWAAVTKKGKLEVDGKLIFSEKVKESDQSNNTWDNNFVSTKQAFSRTKGDRVLRMTVDVRLTQHAMLMLGLCPDAPFHTYEAMKYGYHINRLDRAVWFMEGNNLTHVLRLSDNSEKYHSYRVRAELGKSDGALWQYDIGSGWRTGRDSRNKGSGDAANAYKGFVSSSFYGDASALIDNVTLEYVAPTGKVNIDLPRWGPPVNAEFNGKMDERWTNWAGGLGVTNPKSVADFKTCPGWLTMSGPAGGYGLLLRHYPFTPKQPYFPFYAELKCRYPTVRPPDGNFLIMLHLLVDVGGEAYRDHIAGLCLYLQDILAAKQSQMQVVDDIGQLTGVNTSIVNLPTYWGSGDLYLRIGVTSNTKIVFQYRFSKNQDWATFHTYDTTKEGKTIGFPIGCDVLGPNGTSNWLSPAPKCEPDHISYELDYVHFYK